MAYTVSLSNRFKKDFRRCIKRGLNMKHITDAMDLLEATGMLPSQYRPHKLSGDKNGQWECHIEPDWLMIWEQRSTLVACHRRDARTRRTSMCGAVRTISPSPSKTV